MFAIWKLCKKNYKKFEEITSVFDLLDPQLKNESVESFLS